jgi:hypothetical protein
MFSKFQKTEHLFMYVVQFGTRLSEHVYDFNWPKKHWDRLRDIMTTKSVPLQGQYKIYYDRQMIHEYDCVNQNMIGYTEYLEELPNLPKLPKLPELPKGSLSYYRVRIPQKTSFPPVNEYFNEQLVDRTIFEIDPHISIIFETKEDTHEIRVESDVPMTLDMIQKFLNNLDSKN